MDAVKLAQGLRRWQGKHPVADLGISFVPGVGQVYGAASTAASLIDPEASRLEKGMAATSVMPMGKVADRLRKIVIGEKHAGSQQKELLKQAKAMLQEFLPQAKTRAQRGELDDLIFDNTGWWLGKDGHWRREVSDYRMGLKGGLAGRAEALKSGDSMPLREFVDHPDLETNSLAAAERLRKTKIQGKDLDGGAAGHYDPNIDTVVLDSGRMRDHDRTTVLHELQHAIQEHEGWPSKGANHDRVGKLPYLRNWGEIESRVVEARRNMTDAERLRFPFKDHFRMEADRVYGQDNPSYYPSADETAIMFEPSGVRPSGNY